MDLNVLPLAVTMMAGPQIMSAIILLTAPKPVKVSVSFIVGVAIATTVGVIIAGAVATLADSSISLGDPSNRGSIGNLIKYLLVGLLVALAVKNYVRRETVELPRWLGTLLSADWKRALETGLLVILLMPTDIIILLTVGVQVEQNAESLSAALPFIGATVLIAALPLLIYLLFHRTAQQHMPQVREWMSANSWLINIISCGVFIALILL